MGSLATREMGPLNYDVLIRVVPAKNAPLVPAMVVQDYVVGQALLAALGAFFAYYSVGVLVVPLLPPDAWPALAAGYPLGDALLLWPGAAALAVLLALALVYLHALLRPGTL